MTELTKKGTPRIRRSHVQYSDDLAEEILDRLADGEPLAQICAVPHMPDEKAVRLWALDDRPPGFAERYERARMIGFLKMADDMLAIADDASRDWITETGPDGKPVKRADHDHINRARLKVDTRKFLLIKCLPKIFGDKVTAEVTGPGGGALKVDANSPDTILETARWISDRLAQAKQLEQSRKRDGAADA